MAECTARGRSSAERPDGEDAPCRLLLVVCRRSGRWLSAEAGALAVGRGMQEQGARSLVVGRGGGCVGTARLPRPSRRPRRAGAVLAPFSRRSGAVLSPFCRGSVAALPLLCRRSVAAPPPEASCGVACPPHVRRAGYCSPLRLLSVPLVRVKVKVLPRPSSLRRVMFSLWASMMCLTIESPSPVPPCSRLRLLSVR